MEMINTNLKTYLFFYRSKTKKYLSGSYVKKIIQMVENTSCQVIDILILILAMA